MNKGILITIEGIDGSGKETQAKALAARLSEAGRPTNLFNFPTYDQSFMGKEVKSFLKGEYGELESVHPKLASLLFAADRLAMKPRIESALADGALVICDRYVESNMAHQAAKNPGPNQRDFVHWLDQLEYGVNGMPRPDIILMMEISPSLALRNVMNREGGKGDIQETEQLIRHSSDVYHSLLSPRDNCIVVNCQERHNKMRPINAISEDIFGQVSRRMHEIHKQR